MSQAPRQKRNNLTRVDVKDCLSDSRVGASREQVYRVLDTIDEVCAAASSLRRLKGLEVASYAARSRAISRCSSRQNLRWPVNLKTANVLGLAVPPSIRLCTDEEIDE